MEAHCFFEALYTSQTLVSFQKKLPTIAIAVASSVLLGVYYFNYIGVDL
jgi:hypothetical protein